MEMWETMLAMIGGGPLGLALQVATVGTLVLLLLRSKLKLPIKRLGGQSEKREIPQPLSHVQGEYSKRSGVVSGKSDPLEETAVELPQELMGELLCPKELTERIDRIAAKVRTRSASNRA